MKKRILIVIVVIIILAVVATVFIGASVASGKDEKNGMFVVQTGESTTGWVGYPSGDGPSEQTWPAQTKDP